MCGIAGLWDFQRKLSPDNNSKIINYMTEALSHRGPDAQQIWTNPESGIAFGHRRLAIIDLSNDGLQPMASHDGRYTMIFNGEFYNYKEIRQDLEPHTTSFKGHSDTEVFLAAIQYWGLEKALEKIRGMFAIALWDSKEKELHLIRDRLGKKPLYIGWAGNSLLFASELKAFCAHPFFQKRINNGSKTLFLKYGYTPSPFTIYEEVWQLPPGQKCSFKINDISARQNLTDQFQPYWMPADIVKKGYSSQSERPIEEFEELLMSCVQERMISDVPLGAFLSGGIDSSAIVALMQAQSSKAVKTYTIGFHEEGYNEAEHAKEIAQHLGTDHHELYLNSTNVLDVIPKLSHMYDEPFADISAIPTYLVSKFARESVTVALSGDGGDEMLGGYQRYLSAPKLWNKAKFLPKSLRILGSNIIKSGSSEFWSRFHPKHPQFGNRLHKAANLLSQDDPNSMFDRVLSQCNNPDNWAINGSLPDIPLHDQNNQIQALSFAEQMMFGDTIHYLPNNILVKVDRASMACSLEARAPLLDSRIFEYAWTLPLEMKIKNGKGKWLLREVLKRHVPEHLFERPKQGFTIPVGTWLRQDLRDWGEELLNAQKLEENGLNAKAIQKIWNDHQNRRGAHDTFLWTILMYQSWNDRWLKEKAHDPKTDRVMAINS